MPELLIPGVLSGLNQIGSNVANYYMARENREFYSEPERYKRLVSMGVNPNLAMQSILGAPSQPTATPVAQTEGFTEGMSQLMQAPQFQASINEMESQAAFNEALREKTMVETYILPLNFAEKQRLNDEQIKLWSDQGKLFDSQAGYWSEMKDWVEPLSKAEIRERDAHVKELLSMESLNLEKVKTEVAQQAVLWAEKANVEADTMYKQALTDLTNGQLLTQYELSSLYHNQALRELADSVLKNMDVASREAINGLPLPQDAIDYLVVAGAFGDDDAKKKSMDIIEYKAALDARAYDLQNDNMLANWGTNFLNNLSTIGNDVLGGAAAGFGAAAGSRVFGAAPVGAVSGARGARGARAARAAFNGKNAKNGSSAGRMVYKGTFKHSNGRSYKQWQMPNGSYHNEWVD